ncbi:type II toxin-antitoxin system VapC family toxin [Candidatus Woesearchaeota archaeon]|nr:type II toxin-antitoxin system VapC family toxin [Candidatus Woesearchaeota archaeon]
MKVVDSTFLVDLLRGKEDVSEILDGRELIVTTQINIYEILKGFFLKRISRSKFAQVRALFEDIRVLPLDDYGIIRAAEISSSLQEYGNYVPDCDCLTAGIALSKGINTIVTRKGEHFKRMKGIRVEAY